MFSALRPTRLRVVLVAGLVVVIAAGVLGNRLGTALRPASASAQTGTGQSGLDRNPIVERAALDAAITGSTRRPTSGPTARPNVMLVMMDDMRSDELRFMPNTQRYVADRGLSFTNSYSPYPLCCPARSSFILGKYAHNHRVLFHEAPYGFGAIDDSRTIATGLAGAGYRTALIGKYLNQYGVQPSKVTGESSIRYVPAGWSNWLASLDTVWPKGSPLSGNTYNYFSLTQNVNGTVVPHPGRYSSDVIADQAANLVGTYAGGKKPWFMFLTPVAPHQGGPAEADDPRPVTEKSGRVQKFPTPARKEEDKGRFDREITHAYGTPADGKPAEADIGDKPKLYRALPEVTPLERTRLRDTERQRAESLYAWDRAFGRIVDRLKATGQYDKTVIMFTSDNGYYLGEHRQRLGKIKPHEPVVHVPLLVAGPGVRKGVRQAPITTFDLTATILDIAGGTLPAVDGESKARLLYGPDEGWTYPLVLEGLIEGYDGWQLKQGLNETGVRTGRYKYVHYATGEEELYDLLNDPLELQSRIGDPSYAVVERDLKRIWRSAKDCKGITCRSPLPLAYRSSQAQLAEQSENALVRQRAYYGD